MIYKVGYRPRQITLINTLKPAKDVDDDFKIVLRFVFVDFSRLSASISIVSSLLLVEVTGLLESGGQIHMVRKV